MLLAIDAGNTNVVFALVADGQVVAHWRISTDTRRTADEYAVWLSQLFSLKGFAYTDVSEVIIATVVPRALQCFQVLASKYFHVKALIAGRPPVEWGLSIDIDEPTTLGADRAINSIAAHALHAGDLIIIDLGTATTIDFVDHLGTFRGGIIAPGVNLSHDALATAKLARIAIEPPSDTSVIGLRITDQMHIGIYWGYVAMIEGLVARMKAEVGRPVKVIATGGLAMLFSQHTTLFDVVEPQLTIAGLVIMIERITK